MRNLFGIFSGAALITALLPSNALTWDNRGHGAHRNYAGICVSNYGPTSGCPYGYHLGWNVHGYVPN